MTDGFIGIGDLNFVDGIGDFTYFGLMDVEFVDDGFIKVADGDDALEDVVVFYDGTMSVRLIEDVFCLKNGLVRCEGDDFGGHDFMNKDVF